ncbi:MAG TPA: hypothetical protein VEY93_06890 [Longimicrobium sp.]|nr:hypothetical protein [Longimicrobium sp.]
MPLFRALVAAVILASCDEREGTEAAPPLPAAPAAAAVQEEPAARQPAPSRDGAPARAAGRPPAPTARDSAEAAREDVSPEWKMNERKMGPYSDCMAKAREAPPELHGRLKAACARLPTAPGRPAAPKATGS